MGARFKNNLKGRLTTIGDGVASSWTLGPPVRDGMSLRQMGDSTGSQLAGLTLVFLEARLRVLPGCAIQVHLGLTGGADNFVVESSVPVVGS